MKKFLFFIVLLSLSILVFSQNTWLAVSAKAGYGTGLLFNQPSLDDTNIDYEYYSPSYFAGGKFGFLFGDYIGISTEITFNSFSQNYDVHSSQEYQAFMQVKTFDYGFMLNLQAPTGFYFDIGPKFSNVKSAQLQLTGNQLNSQFDRLDKMTQSFDGLAFGIGIEPYMSDLFEFKIGLRGTYGFGSLVAESGYIIPADDKTMYFPSYSDEKTNPIQLMLNVEFTYVFGRMGRASCGKFRFMLNK
jgi:hypothetical protein